MRAKRNKAKRCLQTVWLLLAWVAGSAQAGQSWSLNTSMSYNQGRYIYENSIENYYVNIGVRYQQPLWTVTITLPFLAQQDNFESEIDLSGDSLNLTSSVAHNGNLEMGVGDIYMFGQRVIWQNFRSRSSLSATFQVKYPLGFSSQSFSSQRTDYGAGLIFKTHWGKYSFFTDVGYLVLGDPEWGTYKNPYGYGLGMSRSFLRRNVTASVYYRAYTEIVTGISPPQQISVGLYGRLDRHLAVSLNLTQGLSESSPDKGISLGLSRKF